ncbi:hypothetical protein [Novosphingobium sp.]|uniref:hypothetical protein n=1 Tax=Novosphingobium sp. TaxID=1874826 RepID=UPI0026293B10|nr:hypothetical protein [Novosphingobium sp.]
MKDRSRQPAAKGTLPAFTPVPRQTSRHDGWTPERQRGFIEALADTGSVKHAAHAVNMTAVGAYYLRRQPEADEFRKAWEAALALGVQRLEDIAMDRALNGVESPVDSYGKIIGTRMVYNDRLLMFILRNRTGKRFRAEGRHDATTRGELSKLKKQWQAEYEAEEAAARAAATKAAPDVLTRLTNANRQWYEALPAPAREAYDAFLKAEAEARAAGQAPSMPNWLALPPPKEAE